MLKTLFTPIATIVLTLHTLSGPALAKTVSVEQLKSAICNQSWDEAIALTSRIIASDGLTPDARAKYVTMRHQLEDQRVASLMGRSPETLPDFCDGLVRVELELSEPSRVAVNQAPDWVAISARLERFWYNEVDEIFPDWQELFTQG